MYIFVYFEEQPGETKAEKLEANKAFVSSTVDVDKLLYYLQHFYLESSRPSHVYGEEDSGAPLIPMSLHAPTHNVQEQTLEIYRGAFLGLSMLYVLMRCICYYIHITTVCCVMLSSCSLH